MSMKLLKNQIDMLKNAGNLRPRGRALVIAAEDAGVQKDIDKHLAEGFPVRDIRLSPLARDGSIWRFEVIFGIPVGQIALEMPRVRAIVSLATNSVVERTSTV